MAKRRRPSIPLIILFVILLLLFLLAGTLVEVISDVTVKGTITLGYQGDSDSIVSITCDLPQDLADAMVLKDTEGWTVSLDGSVLSLTDGTLNSGESVTINYGLSKYIPSGERDVNVTYTTSTGGTWSNVIPLDVTETFLLGIIWGLYQNAIWLLILAIIVLIAIVVLYIWGIKKDKEAEQKKK